MDLILFCTAFILQFVGHRMGDYLFQTAWQSLNKSTDRWARWKHCLIYASIVGLVTLFVFNWQTAIAVYVLTFFEHYWIDSRKPVVGWKTFFEKMSGNKSFNIDELPFFVVIEIDQTMHYVRILVISLLIAYQII